VGGGPRKFRFKNKLVSIDSTVIDLSLSMYDWAKYQRTKGAVKLHLVLDHDGYLPCFGVVTDGTVGDVRVAQALQFDPGTIVVDDRGYNDYALFSRWCNEGVFFVTRMKSDARYEVLEQRPIFAPEGNVLADQRIGLCSEQARRDCPHELRRIEAIHPETGQILVFLTNLHKLSAATIAAIYKDRWQVELFFDCLSCCTPSYVIEYQEPSDSNRELTGVAQPWSSRSHRDRHGESSTAHCGTFAWRPGLSAESGAARLSA
jgi:hypothetical protein